MKRRIGIGGSIASGKSTLSRIFREAGYKVIDADQVARQVVEPNTPGLKAVKEHFPEAFIEDRLDRKALGSIIFQDESKRLLLNNLLHPLIVEECKKQLDISEDLVFLEAPLLFESELLPEFDLTIYVTARKSVQLQRLMKRDGISEEYANQKLKAFREPTGTPSIIVTNNASLAEFEQSAKSLLRMLISD